MYTLNNIAIFKIKYMQMYYLERTSFHLVQCLMLRLMLKLLFHVLTKPCLEASIFTLVLQTLFHGAPIFCIIQ